MKEIIEEKLRILRENFPDNAELRQWLRDSDLWMFTYTVLRVEGIEMNKRQLVDIFEGKLMEELPLDLYGSAFRLRDVYKDMLVCNQMDARMDAKLLARWMEMFSGAECGYRQSNPIIYRWGYIAPHFNELRGLMDELLRGFAKDTKAGGLTRACAIHLGIASLYPYGELSPQAACIAMFYELMRAGIPLPSFTADRDEYDRLMQAYLSEDDREPFSQMLQRSVLNRLDSVVNICMAAGETK